MLLWGGGDTAVCDGRRAAGGSCRGVRYAGGLGGYSAAVQSYPERRLRGMPYFREAGLHPRVLLFAAAISLIAVVVFSVTPSCGCRFPNCARILPKAGAVRRERCGSVSGLTWSRWNLRSRWCCWPMQACWAEPVSHVPCRSEFQSGESCHSGGQRPCAGYEKDDQLWTLSRRLLDHIAAMPGVVSAAHTSDLPITCNCSATEIRVLGHPRYGEQAKALERETSTDYFKTLQTRLIAGAITRKKMIARSHRWR